MYKFILTQYLMKRKDEEYVENAYQKGYITEEERDMILVEGEENE